MNWTCEEINAVNSVLIPKERVRQRPLSMLPSPHGRTASGAEDFRGFPLTRATSVIVSNADFSKSRSPKNEYGVDQSIILTWVSCKNVNFDGARVFHRINGQFDCCSFINIGTEQCGFSGTFTDCDFSGTSFRNAHLIANFVRCKFHDCKMKAASWGSSFADCEFTGASIDHLFTEIRDITQSSERVTFVVLNGKILAGETRHIS